MNLNNNALVDVAYFKLLLNISDGDTQYNDERLKQFINQASQLIETECNRKFITPEEAIDETFDGDSTKDYYVKNARVSETPILYYWESSSWVQLGSSYTFTYSNDSGRVYFTDGNVFWQGSDNWKINYKYGWTLDSLPDDIKVACCYRVKYLMEMVKKGGISSESFGDTNTSFKLDGLLELSKSLLVRYKRVSIG